ncbi:PAS domain-containing sensor histidine kinase [Aestuariivivens sediminicola]|uniref:PAS domain-containing sensor histidine kinase n=1 Tax=Aestuariivivens sediminicola TaxID=2913560 RepID=UPI001F599BEB|nr:PAS domain S-box protein [Aestuariivivens sediminicola]
MSGENIDILKRALDRERAARKEAERILESKSAELYDISQQLKASNSKLEHLVNQKTSELKGVFENIVDAYVMMDLFGNVVKMNDAAVNLLGYDMSTEKVNLNDLTHPEEVERVSEAFGKLLEEGAITNFMVKIVTKDQSVKLVHINASIIFDGEVPIAAQGIVRDITKEKESERQLIESESRLSSLILNLDTAVLLEDENRKIVLTNKKFCDLFQIPAPPEALKGADCSDAAEQSKHLFEDPEGFVSGIEQLLKNRKRVIGDEILMKNGVVLERSFIPIFSNDTYEGHLWKYRDVTLQKMYASSIEAEKQKYSSIIANMNLGLVEVDNNDVIQMVNQSFCDMCGYTEKELIGKKGGELFLNKNDVQIIEQENVKRLKGESNSYEITAKDKNGTIKHWLISGAPNYNINGEVIGSIGIHLDITAFKSLEKQKESLLKKLAKSNEELQDYAHIVSHDLKSPLRSINALIAWLKEDYKDLIDENGLRNFKMIEDKLEKMDYLIDGILTYSSINERVVKSQEVDLNQTIENIKQILLIPEHINVIVKDELPILDIDPIRIQQVFQNFISNAIAHSDKPKGRIEIGYVRKQGHHQFSISDNGVGISPEYHKKIFEIFQSVSEKESTGIGLAIIKKIVNLYNGDVWLESELGKGTTFYFTLKEQSNGTT